MAGSVRGKILFRQDLFLQVRRCPASSTIVSLPHFPQYKWVSCQWTIPVVKANIAAFDLSSREAIFFKLYNSVSSWWLIFFRAMVKYVWPLNSPSKIKSSILASGNWLVLKLTIWGRSSFLISTCEFITGITTDRLLFNCLRNHLLSFRKFACRLISWSPKKLGCLFEVKLYI